VNTMVEGTNLPHITKQTIDDILYSNPFATWWHDPLTH